MSLLKGILDRRKQLASQWLATAFSSLLPGTLTRMQYHLCRYLGDATDMTRGHMTRGQDMTRGLLFKPQHASSAQILLISSHSVGTCVRKSMGVLSFQQKSCWFSHVHLDKVKDCQYGQISLIVAFSFLNLIYIFLCYVNKCLLITYYIRHILHPKSKATELLGEKQTDHCSLIKLNCMQFSKCFLFDIAVQLHIMDGKQIPSYAFSKIPDQMPD